MKPLFRSILLIGAVMIGLTYTVWAQDTQAPVQHPQHKQSTDDSDLFANADTWQALRGLKGFYMLVEALQDNVKDTRLTREAIQRTAELKVHCVGIHMDKLTSSPSCQTKERVCSLRTAGGVS
ncbi:MAG TPA: hypothetical protein VKV29_07205 [Chthonomonas sp.]|uniref:hypothetical protein n=1 Tax=Chthonomonas sp. TaxID=2282153 RepID=UPI002B4B3B93|nr:hypothetical protein [Chthonomonas sp.]HLH80055.1 hypothetical protein [Chthonomonas sp.]